MKTVNIVSWIGFFISNKLKNGETKIKNINSLKHYQLLYIFVHDACIEVSPKLLHIVVFSKRNISRISLYL